MRRTIGVVERWWSSLSARSQSWIGAMWPEGREEGEGCAAGGGAGPWRGRAQRGRETGERGEYRGGRGYMRARGE